MVPRLCGPVMIGGAAAHEWARYLQHGTWQLCASGYDEDRLGDCTDGFERLYGWAQWRWAALVLRERGRPENLEHKLLGYSGGKGVQREGTLGERTAGLALASWKTRAV